VAAALTGIGIGLAATSALATSALAASAIHSPLPGYPRFRGVMLVHDGSAASVAREKQIAAALRQEAAQPASPTPQAILPNDPTPNCTSERPASEPSPRANVCWWGGHVLKAHTVDLIFWQGLETEKHLFPPGYVGTVEHYFENVAAASGVHTNVYGVAAQYGDEAGPGEYAVHFNKSEDVYLETERPLPPSGTAGTACTDPATETATERLCITDNKLREEIGRVQSSTYGTQNGWASSLGHLYFVFTPPRVGGCLLDKAEESERAGIGGANSCALAPGGYCSYHSSFETEKERRIVGVPPVYSNVPDNAEIAGCDSGEHPNGSGGVDATLDAASHEHLEAITDPLSEPLGGTGWHDLIGNEIGDKCVPPEAFEELGGLVSGIYGVPLGGVVGTPGTPGTLFNQQIGSGDYWLQTEWSDSAVGGEGGCVQRMIPAEFTAPGEAKAGTPAQFNGESSGEAGDPPYYWVWNFGDSMQVGTDEPKAVHTYALPGRYKVTLTVYDKYGNSNTVSKEVEVGEAQPPPTTTTTTTGSTGSTGSTVPTVTTVTSVTTAVTSTAAVAHYTSNQIATELGLSVPGTKLAGLGAITFGHGKCPPACSATARLYTKIKTGSRRHPATKSVLIGTVSLTIAKGGTGTIALRLNSAGSSLLRRKHRLAVQLQLTITDQEGGAWQLSRSYALSAAGKASTRKPSARPARHRRASAARRGPP
jgi:hypothetical protein